MATNDVISQEGTDTEDAQFTEHIEPEKQGGARYVRCQDCGREILTSIGREKLGHPDWCSNTSK